MRTPSSKAFGFATLAVCVTIINVSAVPKECQDKADAGTCEKALYRYYYNSTSGDCERFIYTGCGGNRNRFVRRSHCREKCLEGRPPPLSRTDLNNGPAVAPVHRPTSPKDLSPTEHYHNDQPSNVQASPRTALGKPKDNPGCTGCDPLFGVCLPTLKCGCQSGFRLQGRICVDLDECELPGLCPDTATCINTLGGFSCNCGPDAKKCDALFDPSAVLTPPPPPSTNPPFIYNPPEKPLATTDIPHGTQEESVCADAYDMKINENCGVMLPRFYFESLTRECRAVLFGGCQLTSRNIFLRRQDCESLCLKKTPSATHKHRHSTLAGRYPSSPAPPPTPAPVHAPQSNSILSLREFPGSSAYSILLPPTPPPAAEHNDKQPSKRPLALPSFRKFVDPQTSPLPRPPWEDPAPTTADPDPFGLIARSRQPTTTRAPMTSPPVTPFRVPQTERPHHEDKDASDTPEHEAVDDEAEDREEDVDVPQSAPSAVQPVTHPLNDIPQGALVEKERPMDDAPMSSTYSTSECLAPFDNILREECMTSHWAERFYFDRDAEACVPFWYDTSCKAEERVGKNYFESMKDCQRCIAIFDPKKDFYDVTPPVAASKKESMAFTTHAPPNQPLQEHEETDHNDAHAIERDGEDEYEEDDEEELAAVEPLPTTAVTQSKDELDEQQHHNQESESNQDEGFIEERHSDDPVESEEEEERMKTEEAFLAMRNPGACSGGLHPRLEEDCNGGDWLQRWYFSTERGKCRPFWNGGCEVDASNFYSSEAACKSSCGHMYPVEAEMFEQHTEIRHVTGTTTTTAATTLVPNDAHVHVHSLEEMRRRSEEYYTSSSSASGEESLWTTTITPIEIDLKDETRETPQPPTRRPIEDDPLGILPPVTVYPIGNTIRSRGSVSFTTLAPHPAEHPEYEPPTTPPSPRIPAGGPGDPCDDPVDPKLEEECSGDWEPRAYYDHVQKKCVKIWYGGCAVRSRNLFLDVQACRIVCMHKLPTERPRTFISLLPASPPSSTSPSLPSAFFSSSSSSSLRTSWPSWSSPTATNTGTASTHTAGEHLLHGFANHRSEDHEPSTGTATDEAVEAYSATQPTTYHWDDHHDVPHPEPATMEMDPATQPPTFHWEWPDDQHSNVVQPPPATMYRETVHVEPGTPAPPPLPPKRRPTITLKGFTASVLTKVRTPREHQELLLIMSDKSSIEVTEEGLVPVETTTSWKRTTAAALSSLDPGQFDWPWECLQEHKRDAPARECGKDGSNWTQRYYFDHATRSCRMFWGCEMGGGGNNFPDLMSCQWKCEPHRTPPNVRSCLDKMDPTLEDDCNGGRFMTRYHFDFASKRCVSFHYGGCRSPSNNIFQGMEECKTTCERPDYSVAQSCLERFDRGFLYTCNVNGRFEPRYFYDAEKGKCEMFWWGGCRRAANNFFPSLETCKWSCERSKKATGPRQCHDKFDVKLTDSCEDGKWRERWYFDHNTGSCSPFWWDGCLTESANYFRDRHSCEELCQQAEIADIGEAKTLKKEFRCLETKRIGDCRETYPAYYYDRLHRECRPFSYSGCGGNGNRFLTLSHCETLCRPFTLLSDSESACYLPLDTGHTEGECGKQASISYHFDRTRGKCAEFWFRGCGGNGNRFNTLSICNRVCATQRRPGPDPIRKIRSSHACFEPAAEKDSCRSGNNSNLARFTYQDGRCVLFSWSGCGGTGNRFSSQYECESLCGGLKISHTPNLCSYDADWGPCNQLRHMWFFNQSTGLCAQFLYGGCEGNPNKFEEFETCQKTCEVTGQNPCNEPLDRGSWCEPMSNRYYFHKKAKECRGFHYTGCGHSGNNFHTIEDCKARCEKKASGKTDSASAETPVKGKKGKKKTRTTKKPVPPPALRIANEGDPEALKQKVHGPQQYSQAKPLEKTPMRQHIILEGNGTTYLKTDAEWVDHHLCFAYRYNVTGEEAKLETHLCAKESSEDCWSEIMPGTEGDEFCHIVKPFLKGTHKYTWFFSLLGGPFVNGHRRKIGLRAAILIMEPSLCNQIC